MPGEPVQLNIGNRLERHRRQTDGERERSEPMDIAAGPGHTHVHRHHAREHLQGGDEVDAEQIDEEFPASPVA